MNTMILYPAIDLKNNECVRLYQGQFDQLTVYGNDPVAVAQDYADQGATWMHVVDLDGAKQGETSHQTNHTDLILQIQQQCHLNIQTGGGIRDKARITYLLQHGIQRVIIGSLAVTQPNLIKDWLHEFGPEKIVIAVDIDFIAEHNDPVIKTHGWQEGSNIILWDLLDDYYKDGILRHILCTDISRDGTLKGPNLALYQQCQNRYPLLQLQASGGIGSLTDLKELKNLNISGTIIGKALYENRFSLHSALQEISAC